MNTDVFAEIGFGAGLTLRYASGYFKKVIGLDISPKNVELTANELKKEGYNNIELFVLDIKQRDARFQGKCDVISFIHGLEHFSNEDTPTVLSNIKYYLKKRGVFTGALPNDKDFKYRMCPECGHFFEIDGHLSRYSIESLSELFIKNYFKILYTKDFNYHYYLNRKGSMKFLYRFFTHYILKKKTSLGQLEFIVKAE